MLLIIMREAHFADQRQILFQRMRRHQRFRRIAVQAFLMQQCSYLIVIQMGQKSFPGAGSVHRQLAANRG